jgi:hypothetical protein
VDMDTSKDRAALHIDSRSILVCRLALPFETPPESYKPCLGNSRVAGSNLVLVPLAPKNGAPASSGEISSKEAHNHP